MNDNAKFGAKNYVSTGRALMLGAALFLMAPAGAVRAQSADSNLTEDQIRAMAMQSVAQSQQNSLTAGGRDSLLIGPDGQIVNLSGVFGSDDDEDAGDDGEGEKKKKFVYEPKDALDENFNPPRTFNNIDYPY